MIDINERLDQVYTEHGARPALCIDGAVYYYSELQQRVLCVQELIGRVAAEHEPLIGVVARNNLDTYATVLAILRSGRAFVPINPDHPGERNASILRQAQLRTVIGTGLDDGALLDVPAGGTCTIHQAAVATVASVTPLPLCEPGALAYLLFTSGSTGEPKGVPITRGNLAAFLDALSAAGCAFTTHDRVLQMFDLTFDFSIASYLAPLARGACVYTVGGGKAKYTEIYRLLSDERLTVAPLVPSVLNYLRPYFDEIDLPDLRLSIFCGEALLTDVAAAWQQCAPTGRLINFYGPTEATVFAMYYNWDVRSGAGKAMNGMVAIGRPMAGNAVIVIDDNAEPVVPGEKGELCLAGVQLTPGYWQDPARDALAFFEHVVNGVPQRFYRTGDIALADNDGDFYFCGRTDHQVKLQGYRVELGEVEHHIRCNLDGYAFVVVPCTSAQNGTTLTLVVENYRGEPSDILARLRRHLPAYMVPNRVRSLPVLPLNANGKIDRKALLQLLAVGHE